MEKKIHITDGMAIRLKLKSVRRNHQENDSALPVKNNLYPIIVVFGK